MICLEFKTAQQRASSDGQRATGFTRTSQRQTDQMMADMIDRATENARKAKMSPRPVCWMRHRMRRLSVKRPSARAPDARTAACFPGSCRMTIWTAPDRALTVRSSKLAVQSKLEMRPDDSSGLAILIIP